jgi:hypothetical protein
MFFFRIFQKTDTKPLGRWILVNQSIDINKFIETRKSVRQQIKENGLDPYFLYKKQEEKEDTEYLVPFITQL